MCGGEPDFAPPNPSYSLDRSAEHIQPLPPQYFARVACTFMSRDARRGATR
jgi:hypothetical protein